MWDCGVSRLRVWEIALVVVFVRAVAVMGAVAVGSAAAGSGEEGVSTATAVVADGGAGGRGEC